MAKEETKHNDIYSEKVFRDYGYFDNKNNTRWRN